MSSKFFKQTAFLLAGLGAANALSISGRAISLNPFAGISLSSSCQAALLAVAGDQDASVCLNIPGLVAVATVAQNASVVQPVNTWLQGLCAADPCSNSTLSAIATNLTTACQSDLSNAGVSGNVLPQALEFLPSAYTTVRKIGCLKTASNNTLCVSSTLLDIQTSLGRPISLNEGLSEITEIFNDIKSSNLPPSVTCTGCVQAGWNILEQDDPTLTSNDNVQSAVASQCGANFLSGTPSSDVVEGTGSAAPTGSLASSTGGQNSGAFVPIPPFVSIACSSILAVTAGSFMFFA